MFWLLMMKYDMHGEDCLVNWKTYLQIYEESTLLECVSPSQLVYLMVR